MLTKSTNRVVYSGNGATTSFAYDFRVFQNSDLVVTHIDANGVQTVKTITTHYTMTNAGDETGGTVTYPVSGSPLPTGEKLVLQRIVGVLQSTSIRNQSGFYPNVLEDAMDRLAMEIQQINDLIKRAPKLPPETAIVDLALPNLIASKIIGVNSTADGLALYSAMTPGALTVSAFIETFLDDTTASAALTTLGVSSFIQTVLDDTTAASALGTLGAPSLVSNNTFIKDTNIQEIQDTNTGGSQAPLLRLYRNSASPVTGDSLGSFEMYANNSSIAKTLMTRVYAYVDDVTAGSENGRHVFGTVIDGSFTDKIHIGGGLFSTNVTGGDKGADSLNIKTAYDDGDMLIPGSNWSDVSGSRALTTTYQNTKGRPIFVSVVGSSSNATSEIIGYVDSSSPPTGRRVFQQKLNASGASGDLLSVTLMVPVNHYYQVNATNITISSWNETT